jgi:hypothetical protein
MFLAFSPGAVTCGSEKLRFRIASFVSGADTWIDRVVADIPNAENGFTLIFSSTPFPGHQYRLDWRRAESGGNWYYSADLDMEGWLCPALFRYFSDAPASLYAQIKARS